MTASDAVRSHCEALVWILPLTLGPFLGLLSSKDQGLRLLSGICVDEPFRGGKSWMLCSGFFWPERDA